MQVFFLDEAGFVKGDWTQDDKIEQQPLYVLAGVMFDTKVLPALYLEIQNDIKRILREKSFSEKLGKGFEIKANDLIRGKGKWRDKNLRDSVRDIYLLSVKKFNGTAFVVIIDKFLMVHKYQVHKDPLILALNFIYERFDWHLKENSDFGISIHDKGPQEKQTEEFLAVLDSQGSVIKYKNRVSGKSAIKIQKLQNILDNTFAHSENSVGLQIADFFASYTYHYHMKVQRDTSVEWWNFIYDSLKKGGDGMQNGCGYKFFPDVWSI